MKRMVTWCSVRVSPKRRSLSLIIFLKVLLSLTHLLLVILRLLLAVPLLPALLPL